jgi:hypothetical protein
LNNPDENKSATIIRIKGNVRHYGMDVTIYGNDWKRNIFFRKWDKMQNAVLRLSPYLNH